MSTPKWASRVLRRYILSQLPALALFIMTLILIQRWLAMPIWLFWTVIGIWLAKDAVLYPLVWRAYHPEPFRRVSPLVGAQGIAQERLAPTGYIDVRGALWKATLTEGSPPVDAGEAVCVKERQDFVLLVQPWYEVAPT